MMVDKLSDKSYLEGDMRGQRLTERKAMRCTAEEHEAWEAAATREGLSWSAWAAGVLNAAIEAENEPAEPAPTPLD